MKFDEFRITPSNRVITCQKHPETGLLFVCPACKKERRAEASRENGKKGGRGRKRGHLMKCASDITITHDECLAVDASVLAILLNKYRLWIKGYEENAVKMLRREFFTKEPS